MYDAVGNLTQAITPTGTTNRAYDLADRVTTSGYTYDDNGALTADPARGYGYDGFGRLVSISGTTAATYSLDGAGNRLAQTFAGVTTSFDLDVSVANPTILADGTRTYLPGDPAAGYAESGTWYSALADQAGSPHSTVSEAGTQSGITRYDPFGAARPGSTVPAGIGYAGEWADATGLVNLRSRAYDPSAGRFTSRDGFAGLAPSPQTANRYSYALNGPYRYTDPSGRFVSAIYANAPFLLSMALTATPGVGLLYGGLMAVTGYDPITGHHLSDLERGLAILPLAGKAFSTLSHLGEGAADAGRLAKADDLASIGRAGSGRTRLGMRAEGGVAGASVSTASASQLARTGAARSGAGIGLNDAAKAATKNGIDMRSIELAYEPGSGRTFGFISQTGSGNLVRGESGKFVVTLTDTGLATRADAVNTIAHEVNHIREILRGPRGTFVDNEAAANLAGDTAERYLR